MCLGNLKTCLQKKCLHHIISYTLYCMPTRQELCSRTTTLRAASKHLAVM